jgi:fructose-1,6-bisphosphatase/inositol monophosphatase family enzyme
MHATLNIAVKAARRAATVINRASTQLDLLTVQSKSPNDFVTEVDRAAEQAIIDVLRDAFPNHGILAEESGELGPANGQDSEFTWIIDPLDGTTNFIHGFPQYAVSIAQTKNGVLEQGVVYDPNTQRAVHRHARQRRLPQRQAASACQRRIKPRRGADRNRLPLPHVRPHRRLPGNVQASSHRRPPASVAPAPPR